MQFPREIIQEFGRQTFGTCDACENGRRNQINEVIRESHCTEILRRPELLSRHIRCEYPCYLDYVVPDIKSAFQFLVIELNKTIPIQEERKSLELAKNTFLSLLVETMFPGVTLSIPTSVQLADSHPIVTFFMTKFEVKFGLIGCSNQEQYDNITKTVLTVCSAIIPSSSLSIDTAPPNFDSITLWQREIDLLRILLVGIPVGALLLIPILVPLIYLSSVLIKYLASDIRKLPFEVSWSYLAYLKKPWEWETQGSGKSWYHFKELKFGSYEWKKVKYVFREYLDGTRLKVETITTVYNPWYVLSSLPHPSLLPEIPTSKVPARCVSTVFEFWISSDFFQFDESLSWSMEYT